VALLNHPRPSSSGPGRTGTTLLAIAWNCTIASPPLQERYWLSRQSALGWDLWIGFRHHGRPCAWGPNSPRNRIPLGSLPLFPPPSRCRRFFSFRGRFTNQLHRFRERIRPRRPARNRPPRVAPPQPTATTSFSRPFVLFAVFPPARGSRVRPAFFFFPLFRPSFFCFPSFPFLCFRSSLVSFLLSFFSARRSVGLVVVAFRPTSSASRSASWPLQTGSMDPSAVDFSIPRWAPPKKPSPSGSFARLTLPSKQRSHPGAPTCSKREAGPAVPCRHPAALTRPLPGDDRIGKRDLIPSTASPLGPALINTAETVN